MKRNLLYFLIILTAIVAMFLPVFSSAHSGRTDKNGGHLDRSTGEYHFHTGEYAGKSSSGISNKNKSSIPSTWIPVPVEEALKILENDRIKNVSAATRIKHDAFNIAKDFNVLTDKLLKMKEITIADPTFGTGKIDKQAGNGIITTPFTDKMLRNTIKAAVARNNKHLTSTERKPDMIFILTLVYAILPILIIYSIFKFIIYLCYRRTQKSLFRATVDSNFIILSRFSSYTAYEPGFKNIKRILFVKGLWTIIFVLAGILVINFSFAGYLVLAFTFIQLMRANAELKYYKRMKDSLSKNIFSEEDHIFMAVYRLPCIYQYIQFIITPIMIYCYDLILNSML